MPLSFSDLQPKSLARIAGVGYLVIIVAGIFAEFFVRSSLLVPGDAVATVANIKASESFFRLGIAADTVMLIFDVIVALALYLLLASVDKTLALLATFFRLVHTAVVGAGLLSLMVAVLLLDTPSSESLVMTFLDAHGYGYVLGLVFFGVHCFLLGWLVYRSGMFPKILGALLIIAAAGYLTDSFAQILLTDYAAVESTMMAVVFVPAFVAELSFTIWLLVKGIK